jgi:hypothetical protein
MFFIHESLRNILAGLNPAENIGKIISINPQTIKNIVRQNTYLISRLMSKNTSFTFNTLLSKVGCVKVIIET